MRDDPRLMWPPLDAADGIGPAPVEEVKEWALVLAAFGIPCSIGEAPDGEAVIRTDPFRRDEAVRQLRLWNREAPYIPPPPPEPRWRPDILVPGLLILFHLRVFLTPEVGKSFLERGALSGIRLAAGEWWRPLSALLFHRDLLHLLFNIIPLALLLPSIAARTGKTIALSWVLLGAVAGNAAAALIRDPNISSIGASTMVFTAFGMALLLRNTATGWGRIWLGTAGAGIVFLAMSAGSGIDMAGHLFGFLAGIVPGILWLLGPWKGPGMKKGIRAVSSLFALSIFLVSVFFLFRSLWM